MRIDADKVLGQIFSCMNELVRSRDFNHTMSLLTQMGSALVNSDRASFWIKDDKNNEYWTIAASGVDKITIPKGSGIVGYAIENNQVVLINDPYSDNRFNSEIDKLTGYITKSILCVPVVGETGEVIGAYQAINKLEDTEAFNEQDVRLIELVTVLGGKTLESHILYMQSHLDQLTGLKNRRGLIDDYNKYMSTDKPAAIIMCDIDFFKKVNDTYGHNAGDAVLIFIADKLVNAVGHRGEVYRWGGEEFVILLYDCDLDKAADLAEYIRDNVEKSVCVYEDIKITKTMSFGVTKVNKDEPLSDNISRADNCMYVSKSTGRNKVTIER